MRRQWLMLVAACFAATIPSACGGSTTARAVPEKASPPEYKVKLETTKGDVVILVHREWAPIGADHFYNLVTKGYYNDNAFFRAIKGFVVQWGMNGDPKVYGRWSHQNIKDDATKVPNKTGTVTFAQTGSPNSRSTHIFININDNSDALDPLHFTPFGEVIEGMDNVMNLYMDYGDAPPNGAGPDQEALAQGGNAYLQKNFPKLDYIKKATVIDPVPAPAPPVVHKKPTTTATKK